MLPNQILSQRVWDLLCYADVDILSQKQLLDPFQGASYADGCGELEQLY